MQKKRNTEIKTKIKITKPEVRNADASLIQNSTSITTAKSAEKDSKNPQKAIHHPHEKSLEVSKKDYRISPEKSIRSHKNFPENPRIEKETSKTDIESSTMHAVGVRRSGSGRRVTHAPENTVYDVPGSGATHDPGSGLTHDLGSGEAHSPGGGVKHETGNGASRDPNSDEEHETKADNTLGTRSSATSVPISEAAELVCNQVLNSPNLALDSPNKQPNAVLISYLIKQWVSVGELSADSCTAEI